MAITVASLQARLSADVKSFSSALGQAQQELDRLGRSGQLVDAGIGKANGALRHLERDLKPARAALFHMHGSTNDLSKSLNSLSAVMLATGGPLGNLSMRVMGFSMLAREMNAGTLLLVGGLGAASLALIETASAGLRAHIQMQKIDSALRVGTGSSELAAEAYGFVRDEARRLGVDLETSAQQFGKLSAAARGTSLEGDGARRIFSATAEAATVLGLSSAETSGMLNAFQQMISKGKVQAEELRGQLGERLPGAFQMAARAMGVTTAELNKMLEDGKVLAEDLLPKLAAEMHKTFGAEAVKASGNLQQSINKVKTEFFELSTVVGGFLAQGAGPLLTFLAEWARWLNEISSFKGVAPSVLADDHAMELRKELIMLEGLAARGQTRMFDVGSFAMTDVPARITELKQYLAAYEQGAHLARSNDAARARSRMPRPAAPPAIAFGKDELQDFKKQLSALKHEVDLGDRSLTDYLAILQAYVPGMSAAAAKSEQGAEAFLDLRVEIRRTEESVKKLPQAWLGVGAAQGELTQAMADGEAQWRDMGLAVDDTRRVTLDTTRALSDAWATPLPALTDLQQAMADNEMQIRDMGVAVKARLTPMDELKEKLGQLSTAGRLLGPSFDVASEKVEFLRAEMQRWALSGRADAGPMVKYLREEMERLAREAGSNSEAWRSWRIGQARDLAAARQNAGDYTGFIVAQFKLQAVQMNTTWTGIATVVRDTTSAMSSTLSDGFFQLFTEGTVNAGDLFEDFTKRMARSLANFLADAAVKGFLGFALGLAGGGTILRLGGSGSDRIPALLSPGETVLSSGQTGVLGSLLKSIGALPEGAGGNLINTALGKALEKFGADIASLNVSQGGAPGLLFGLQEVPGHFEFPGQAATPGLLGSGGQVGQTGATLSQLSSAVAGVAGVFGGLSTVLSAQTEGGQIGGAVAMAGAVTAMMGNPLLGAGLAIVGALMPSLFGDEAAPARRAGRNRVSNDTLRATLEALDSGDLARDVGGLRAGDLVYTMAVEQLDNAFASFHSWPANPAFAAIRDRFGAAGFTHRGFNVGDVNSVSELIGWSGTPTDAMNGFTTYTGVALWEDLLRSVATQLTGVQAPITQLPPLTSEGARQMLANATEYPVDMTLAKFTLDRFGIPGYTIVQGGDPQDPYTKLVSTEETISGYGTGGVVDGPLGEPQLAVVHGGEEVLTPEQRAGRGGSVLVVQLVTPDRRVLAEQVIEGIKILDSAGHTGIPSSFVYTRRRN